MAEKEQAAKPSKKTEAARGAWVVVDDGGQVLVVESSEIKAFRAAAEYRARVIFWQFGKTAVDVVAPVVTP